MGGEGGWKNRRVPVFDVRVGLWEGVRNHGGVSAEAEAEGNHFSRKKTSRGALFTRRR